MVLHRRLYVLVMCLALLALPAPSRAEPRVDRYNGVCDASAAVALDAHHFVVGDDKHDVLMVYRFGTSDPIATAA